jgi:type VI secretion system FHA domain protein
MALRLEIVSRHRQSLGERGIKEFGPDGGTIGRSLESDWVLPDGQRYMSSRHASVDFRSGSYYIIDTSTNGVYINDAEEPVGRGNPQRLFNGDRIRMGDYEMSVTIDELDSTREQLADTKHVDPVDRAMHVEAPEPTTYDLVDAYEITGVGIEYLLDEDEAQTLNPPLASNSAGSSDDTPELSLAEDSGPRRTSNATPRQTAQSSAAKTSSQPEQRKRRARSSHKAQAQAKPAPRHKQASAPGRSAGAATALDAFFKGAGLAAQRMDDKQAQLTLHVLGQLFRETIVGLTENLHLRSAQKNALRQPNTTIQPRANNPLKFSAGVDEAMTHLIFREESAEYLSAVDSVREAFGDVKLHQQCVLHAIQIAVSKYVARLDPDQLEEKFSSGKRGPLMNAANKLKYWDFYKDLYLVVAQHPTGELPAQFLEELSRAYEAEMTKAGEAPAQNKLKAG